MTMVRKMNKSYMFDSHAKLWFEIGKKNYREERELLISKAKSAILQVYSMLQPCFCRMLMCTFSW